MIKTLQFSALQQFPITAAVLHAAALILLVSP
jgi:hypothetical protein